MTGDDFAGLLRELKERSGLSYGALGKRLHMSASTVHRYVSGDVVPTDYAPVERLARVCRATPDELLELHRRWVRADALRGVRSAHAAQAAQEVREDPRDEPQEDPRAGEAEPDRREPEPAAQEAQEPVPAPAETLTGHSARKRRWNRPRTLLAATGAGAVAATVVLVANLVPGHPDGRTQDAANVTSTHSPTPTGSRTQGSGAQGRSASPSPSASGRGATASTSPSASAPVPRRNSAGGGSGDDKDPAGVPVTVDTTPYYWDSPCDQSFLVDRSPGNVPPPPAQQDAVGWATALGAVAADHQTVTLTVQGTGARTVVLRGLHARIVRSDAPPAWNKFEMGDGCGGQVNTKAFDVSLDLGNPLVHPIGGQRDFPYKVSESDPEVFYVNAHTSGHDVSWYLELDWSSGSRSGTVRIDDHGKPFRTSGSGKPYYGYPLGGDAWVRFPGE
ncbi:transcriptional regulator [Streptomyces naganishii]|uniref:Transcriptional regulator n=1 Tax=Streptomyces naganishii JCM 4654 TaxID=1306179 RepID=A0A919CY10_9ACTN|nr:helix-turn-helix domain-containing protein [Streptomyces naganishii]GHD93903.1 transcriptional regulator [Streptomyces naganishii JCM 4654]